MSRLLTPQELVLLETDTDYINAGIPILGSRVVNWMNRYILIYHTQDVGYAVTDITDMGQNAINEIAKVSEVHGFWYYLPQSISETIAEEAETAVDVAKAAGKTGSDILVNIADTLGKTMAALIKPLADTLTLILIAGVAIGVIYLIKKG
jgi:hypothetical protein